MSDALIRAATPADTDAIDRLCRATAQSGEPQPDDVADPILISLVYALPYLHLEPQTARVLERHGRVAGYVVGAVDSYAFYRRWSADWATRHLPRPRGADPDLVALLAEPLRALPAGVDGYPSHLHINLAPAARGGGLGKRLLDAFLDGLRAAGSPGVHLRVAADNQDAVRFYCGRGFMTAERDDETLTMVRGWPPSARPPRR